MKKPRTIKWYVVHARDYREYNEQLVAFGRSLGEKSGGALNIEFVYSQVGSGWRDEVAERDGYARVTSGEFDVSQLGVDTLGAKVISYPYVFRNYDHAEAVWRGPIGKKLLASISAQSGDKLEAMAFSYSGGFRALVGTRAVRTVDDVKGAKVMLEDGLSPDGELLMALGATPAVENPNSAPVVNHKLGDSIRRISDLLAAGTLDLFSVEINGLAYAEQAYAIPHAPLFMNVTDHTMYATSIVANRGFLDSLEPELRQLLIAETRRFAIAERQLSARLAMRNLDAFEAVPGRTVVPVTEASRRAFREVAKVVMRRHPALTEMVKEIQESGELPLLPTATSASP